jgi:hypothetical protein
VALGRGSEQPAISATTIIVNHTGLPADRSPEALPAGALQWRCWHAAQRHAQDLGTRRARPTLDARAAGPRGARRDHLRRRPGDVRLNFPVDSLVATFGEIYGSFLEIARDMPDDVRRKLFHDNAMRIYRL